MTPGDNTRHQGPLRRWLPRLAAILFPLALVLTYWLYTVATAKPVGITDELQQINLIYEQRLGRPAPPLEADPVLTLSGALIRAEEDAIVRSGTSDELLFAGADFDLAESLARNPRSQHHDLADSLFQTFLERAGVPEALRKLDAPDYAAPFNLTDINNLVPENVPAARTVHAHLAARAVGQLKQGETADAFQLLDRAANILNAYSKRPLAIDQVVAGSMELSLHRALLTLTPDHNLSAETIAAIRATMTLPPAAERYLAASDAERLFAQANLAATFAPSGRIIITDLVQNIEATYASYGLSHPLLDRFGRNPTKLVNLQAIFLPNRAEYEAAHAELQDATDHMLRQPAQQRAAIADSIAVANFKRYRNGYLTFAFHIADPAIMLANSTIMNERSRLTTDLHLATLHHHALHGTPPASTADLASLTAHTGPFIDPETGNPLTLDDVAEQIEQLTTRQDEF